MTTYQVFPYAPSVASCSAGKAVQGLSVEDYKKYASSLTDPRVSAKNIGKWLTTNSQYTIRERMMQRHRIGDCACEYGVSE